MARADQEGCCHSRHKVGNSGPPGTTLFLERCSRLLVQELYLTGLRCPRSRKALLKTSGRAKLSISKVSKRGKDSELIFSCAVSRRQVWVLVAKRPWKPVDLVICRNQVVGSLL